ncbi:MAG: NADP-dependent isocitrate dehydrogenase [Planctomycetes bacterium]|nr:NADP-dependent isocitrate dehydrogenase [Planctomycetota bacterium]
MRYQTNPRGKKRVTLIEGDGIGPEVVGAARAVLEAAQAPIAWEVCAAGAKVFKAGLASGVPPETAASIRETRVVLKGPLETPVGYGEKSANVTLRKLFETYANVRPIREFPGVPTPFRGRGIDLIVVRENVEDLYAGIEHMQTPGVAQCLKIMTRKGCEKIVRLAFEVAVAEGRRSIHCATKANIMKLTEGLMKRTFEEVAKEYPQIHAQHIIVDNCAHMLVKHPEQFEVIVTSNMNGDILSDLTSGLVGGLGFAPGANLGNEVAIFEAVHGSAPKYAGTNTINPTAVILSAVMLLRHIDEPAIADQVERAVLRTLEEGSYTRDVRPEGALATTQFTERIIRNLKVLKDGRPVRDRRTLKFPELSRSAVAQKASTRRTAGIDLFVETDAAPEALGARLESLVSNSPFRLKMISNRGTKVFPVSDAMPDCVDHWRCRFLLRDPRRSASDEEIRGLVQTVEQQFPWMHLEKLQEFDGSPAWTKAQGEE